MICASCKHDKPATEFYRKTEKQLHSYCKLCFNSYCKERWIEKKKQAIAYKGGKCVDCSKIEEFYLFDFHHLDRNEKEYDWSKLRLFSWERIKRELDKCILLCVRCHRIREHKLVLEAGLEPA